MKNALLLLAVLTSLAWRTKPTFGQVPDPPSILSSQVGYNLGEPMRIMVRSSRPDCLSADAIFTVSNPTNPKVMEGNVTKWGEKWGSHWWIADFSGLNEADQYVLEIKDEAKPVLTSDPIEVGDRILWGRCYQPIAFDFLDRRSKLARTGKGWKDCGSDLQEFSSHVVAIDGVCDLLEFSGSLASPEDQQRLLEHIVTGCDYLAHLQDKAQKLGLGNGAVLHEDRQTDVVTGNVAKGAMILARASRLLQASHAAESADYLERAGRAFQWIKAKGPIVNPEKPLFYPHVHGAPPGSGPPQDQWMTRDLVMMTRAAVELFRAGQAPYRQEAVLYANRVLDRQVPEARSEDGLSGHFYTYEDYSSFGGVRFTEKANIHCGAWSKNQGRLYNKGGHYPHYLIPLLDMIRLWPDHPQAGRWRRGLRNFAYGYFLPACQRSPFLILPAGVYTHEGLLYFGSWYHAHNNIYAFAASLALEFEKLFDDRRFRLVAVGNLQWIAGLNCGLREGASTRFLPVSMIAGIGARARGSWTGITGSICNGFSASRQFSIAAATSNNDRPVHFDNEAYIAHSLPYLAALVRLEASRGASKRP